MHDKLYRENGFQQRPHTLTLLYMRSNVGPVKEVMDAISHLRTIIIDTVLICQDFLVELRLLKSRVRNPRRP